MVNHTISIVPVLGHSHGSVKGTVKYVSPAFGTGGGESPDQGGDPEGGEPTNVIFVSIPTSSGQSGGDSSTGGEPIIMVGGSVA